MNKNNIVSIDAVIARIKMNGYIDCNEYDDYYDIHEYDNILFYLEKYKDLQSKIDKVNNYIDSEREKIQQHQYSTGIRRLNKIQNILKEDK